MNTSRPAWRAALVGVALSVVCVLLLAPPTGWLARAQFAAVGFHLPQSDAQRQAAEAADRQRIARQFPDDVDVQIAAALGSTDQYSSYLIDTTTPYPLQTSDISELRLTSLRALVSRFVADPALYATLLRLQALRLHSFRPDENLILQLHLSPDELKSAYARPTPASLAMWDADCAAGERLDSHNGFFPMMRAAGLYAAYRDEEATEAVLRAGRRPLWNDYVNNEIDGQLHLAEAVHGRQSGLHREAIFASTLLPHFSKVRAVACVATVQAMQMEQVGNIEKGLAVRRALINVGDRMRVQSPTEIGSLVGTAIATLATLRPGGAAPLEGNAPAELDDVQQRHWYSTRRVKQFATYALQHGHPELADIVHTQETARETIQVLYTQASPKALYNKLLPYVAMWITGEATLFVVSWLLVLGFAAQLLSRRAAFREVRPLSRSTKWGSSIATLLALAVAGFEGASGNNELQINIFFIGAILFVLGAGALFLLRRRITRSMLARSSYAFFGTLLMLFLCRSIISWQMHSLGETSQFMCDLRTLSGNEGDATEVGFAMLRTLSLGALPLAIPLLLLLVFSVWGRVRRVPVSVAVVRGFLSSAVPVACVLLLVWGGLCLVIVRQERQLNAELDRMTTHEGRYYASLTGAQWPGPAVPE